MYLNFIKMRKKIIYILIISFTISSFCSKDDNHYAAINDYLETVVKNPNQEIIIIREKISTNQTLNIFRGQVLKESNKNQLEEREDGVKSPLYQKKYWKIMEKKYHDFTLTEKDFWNKNKIWNTNDFKHKKIEFISFNECLKHFELFNFQYESERRIYSFSEPIYYKNEKYVTFTIEEATTKSIEFGTSYIVVMKKVGGKWIVINRTSHYILS